MSGRFEVIDGSEGTTHHLDGLPLRDGDAIDIQLGDGSWLSGSYTWSGHRARWPVLRLVTATVQGFRHSIPVVLHPDCVIRRTPKP